MKNLKFLILFVFFLHVVACVNENDFDTNVTDDGIGMEDNDDSNDSDGPLADLSVPDEFSYETTRVVELTLDAPTFLNGAVFSLYSKVAEEDSISIGKGTFNQSSRFKEKFTVSSRVDSLLIFSEYTGLVDNVRIPVNSSVISFDYRPLYERNNTGGKSTSHKPKRVSYVASEKADYTFIDAFNAQGVPENLAFADVIQQNLLDDINASLPESIPGGIPVTNPEYLAGKETSLIVTKEADVWVTFVSEGAGYRNVLGYYSYPVGQEPTSADDIIEHKVIFPNVSMQGSGGGLVPGDRVYLGRFPANTVVSWFLASNGWTGSGVRDGNGVYYSNPDFNPEGTEAKRNHMVLLYDEVRELTLLGFEDLFRDGPSDDDFNDAVFYAKANPVDAIQIGNLAAIQTANDADGDGINDELDDFPFDVNKAFNNFSPSVNSKGILAYEDLWPNQGDYDFNDLVMDYTFTLIANSENLITAIDGNFTVDHIGASFQNGFAFVLPIDPNTVESVEGQILNGGYEDVAANGTENGTLENETVIIVAGNTFPLEDQTISISITLNQPISREELGDVPFNAFLIVNADRAREVHLPDLPPTSKAGYLGSGDDFSDQSASRFYKTSQNLPWALNIYEGFTAPPERVPITLQYPKFVNWANSGGVQDQDWFIR